MTYQFYVNMQKRADGAIYADLHKTDERIYFTNEDALVAIQKDAAISIHRHVVPMVAMTDVDYERDQAERSRIINMLKEALPHCPDVMRTAMESELSAFGVA